MEIETKSQKKKPRKLDRITLTQKNLTKVDAWLEAIKVNMPGGTLTRSDVVNWLIDTRKSDLKMKELKAIAAAFSDEVKLAKWAYEEVKAARKRGETVTLAEILLRQKQNTKALSSNRGPYKKTRKQNLDSEFDFQNLQTSDDTNSSKASLEKAHKVDKNSENTFQN